MSRQRRGVTKIEVIAVVGVLAVLLAVVVPVVAGGKNNAGIQQSMANLVAQSAAHLLYAADWNGRQVTHNPDDLGAFDGDPFLYNGLNGCDSNGFDPGCQPPIIAGYGPTDDNVGAPWVLWAYWPNAGNRMMLQPINFPGPPNDNPVADGWGYWRFPQSRPLHDYLNGRYHDPVFFAPNDASVVDPLAPCFGQPQEYVAFPYECNPGWSSYCRSPAAVFHPDVMRSNAAGGWQAPYDLDYGYETPGLFQATYPDLKTHLLEHSWVQNPPGPCNPAFFGCEPYYFNAGIGSAPVTLFYDGHVRLLPNTEVLFADFEVLMQTGQVDGLWHRGTPFGESGYHIDDGYDGVPLSHHVLTTDGILGRDTLGGASPMGPAPSWAHPTRARAVAQKTLAAPEPFEAEDLP